MNLLVIMSHDLSDVQVNEAKDRLKVDKIKTLPQELRDIWSNITPYGELPIEEINKIGEWIIKESDDDDYVLVQGEFGATFYVVDLCFKRERIPIYATTERVVMEEKSCDGVITKRIFRHQRFRRYKRYE